MPAGGPALDGSGWRQSKHPKHQRREKPYLTDVFELGQAFRDHYLAGLESLIERGKLKLGGTVREWSESRCRGDLIERLRRKDWNVFAEGPPHGKSDPLQVLKYLARYLTGGPISDRRLIAVDEEEVTFWARPKKSPKQYAKERKAKGLNRAEPFSLSGREFVYRWSQHILPKHFVRTRAYGGYHHSKKKQYLALCRELLPAVQRVEKAEEEAAVLTDACDEPVVPKCPSCQQELSLISSASRPSWKQVFEVSVYASPPIYSPIHHRCISRAPPN